MRTKILAIASLCISTGVYAGGYRVALQGESATGMGHTGVAVTDSAEVVFFNPAGMSLLSTQNNLATGISLIDSITKYQNASTSTTAETDNPLGTPAYVYLSRKHNEAVAYGFGFYTPYGNTVTWPDDWTGSHLVNNISLKTMYFQPTVSFKPIDQLSVGVGVNYVLGSVEFNKNLSTALVDSNGDRANVTIDASNISSWGYNLGVMVRPVHALTLGLSYRSKVELQARGENADFENIPSSLQTTYPDTTYDANLVLPAELTVGVSYMLGTNTLLAFDINRTFWSAYEALNVTFDNGAGEAKSPRNYSDANIYRIGVQQRFGTGLSVRVGAYYDQSPISTGYYTPETARNDSIGLTAGASYNVIKNLQLTMSFLYLIFDEFNGSYDHIEQSGSTISFGGDYKSSVRSLGLGLNYQF